ncbi:MAG: hypothetical protein HPY62_07625 [Bacteroidales bacterium]|nr:hypothetical protein [Bacteroidales bacterium]
MKTLTSEQRIAQCIWIAGYSGRDVAHEVEITDLIRKYGPGGIVFFREHLPGRLNLPTSTRRFQKYLF